MQKPNTVTEAPKVTRDTLFLAVTTFSRAKRIVKSIFGPTGRVTHRAGEMVKVGYEGDNGPMEVVAEAKTFAEALEKATADIPVDDLLALVDGDLNLMQNADGAIRQRQTEIAIKRGIMRQRVAEVSRKSTKPVSA